MTVLIRNLVLTGLSAMAVTVIVTAIWPTVAVVVGAVLWVELLCLAGAALVVAVRYARARLALRRVVPEVVPASARPVAAETPRPAAGPDELVESA